MGLFLDKSQLTLSQLIKTISIATDLPKGIDLNTLGPGIYRASDKGYTNFPNANGYGILVNIFEDSFSQNRIQLFFGLDNTFSMRVRSGIFPVDNDQWSSWNKIGGGS